MKRLFIAGIILSLWLAGCSGSAPANPAETESGQVEAVQPQDVTVTVYKAPT